MFCGRVCPFWALAVIALLTLHAIGQSVISSRSGIVHFFEGVVYLGDQPLEFHPGKFPSIPQGAELRTAEGRAEVLLTPDVFVRIGERSTIRIIANELSDTRVELLAGSAIVSSVQSSSDNSVTLIYADWTVRFLEQGVYRINSDRLWVLEGGAEVSADAHEALTVGPGMDVPFAAVLVPEQSIDQPHDALTIWAEGRQESISAENTIAANTQDPASMTTSKTNSSNSAQSFSLPAYTYLPAIGMAAAWTAMWISEITSSTGPQRSSSLSPSTRTFSANVFSDARSSAPWPAFLRRSELFGPRSARGQLHLAIHPRSVSSAGPHAHVHR